MTPCFTCAHVALRLLVRVEDDVRVAVVELAIVLLGPVGHLELDDAPDLQSHCIASALPGGLRLRGFLLHLLLRVGAKQGQVAVFPVILLRLSQLQRTQRGKGVE